jgi:hypothetical protein
MGWPLVAGIVGSSLLGGIFSSKAAKKGAAATRDANQRAIDEQRRQYDTTRADLGPYRKAGAEALGRLWDPEAFDTSPGYLWRKSEGIRDLENRFSVGGGGGNAMRALVQYNQNFASNEHSDWWDRNFRVAEAGRGATTSGAMMGERTAGNIGNAMMSTGRSDAAGYRDYYSGINNAVQSGIGNWMYANQRGWLGGQGSPGSNYGYPTYSDEMGPPISRKGSYSG